MKKTDRQKKIIEIINERPIETQEELQVTLLESGIVTTQATLSRDIRELGLKKTSAGTGGRQRYITREKGNGESASYYREVLRTGIISIEEAENLIVVKTVSGAAMAAAAAIDNMSIEGIVGCIAGDDTIFVAVKRKSEIQGIMTELSKL
jgi:transcriptional regulator of arginine metabolism